MMNHCNKIALTTALVLIISLKSFGLERIPSDSLRESGVYQLKKEIEKVIEDYNGLCVGLALIRKDRPDRVFVLGQDQSACSVLFRYSSIDLYYL